MARGVVDLAGLNNPEARALRALQPPVAPPFKVRNQLVVPSGRDPN